MSELIKKKGKTAKGKKKAVKKKEGGRGTPIDLLPPIPTYNSESSTLRWVNVEEDPEREAIRIATYKEKRRLRYDAQLLRQADAQ